MKREIDADVDLQRLVATSDAVFDEDQRNAKESNETLDVLRKGLAEELDAFAKMLG